MSFDSQTIDQNLSLFLELLSCTGRITYWCYDEEGRLLNTTCTIPVMEQLFRHPGTHAYMMEKAREYSRPLILTNEIELVWSAVFEKEDGNLRRIHVLGPVFVSQYASRHFEDHLHGSKVDLKWRPKLIRYLKETPLITLDEFFKATLQLFYCVTGEKITPGDLRYQQPVTSRSGSTSPTRRRDAARSWMAEQAMLNCIREGRPFRSEDFAELVPYSAFLKINLRNTLTNTKIQQSVFIALCIRAAIEGGLSPEAAYARGDAFIQNVMEAGSTTEILELSRVIYDDFVQEVRRIRSDNTLTTPIRSCCDYIHEHITEPLSITDLATRVGYADYYLSRKFKEETGMSVNDYIKKERIEEAKHLMESSRLSIPDIAEKLQFGNRSFFSKVFKELTGTSPAAYIAENRRL